MNVLNLVNVLRAKFDEIIILCDGAYNCYGNLPDCVMEEMIPDRMQACDHDNLVTDTWRYLIIEAHFLEEKEDSYESVDES